MASIPKPSINGFLRFTMYAVIAGVAFRAIRPYLPASISGLLPTLS